MKVRYSADNDLRNAIVRGAVRQEPEVDLRSAQSARLDGVPIQMCYCPVLWDIFVRPTWKNKNSDETL
ncbi:MAG: hypothetical protein WD696_18465 [Bryobacteraceae bacterium]